MPESGNHDERRRKIMAIVADMLAAVGAEHATNKAIAQQSGDLRGVTEHPLSNRTGLIAKTDHWVDG